MLLATVYDTEGKERQMAEQKAELIQLELIVTAIVMLLVIIFLAVYAYRRRKANIELRETNRQLIRQIDEMTTMTDIK